MERWQGLPSEVKAQYAVIRTVKRTAEKEIVLLQHRESSVRVLLRNYPGEPSAAYRLVLKKTLPHIPEIYAVEPREGGYYVLEQFIEGKTLGGECLSASDALRVLKELCEALTALHALGIVHRDVKPDNLLQTPSGGIFLLDLDAARQYKSHVEKDTCMLGTTGFAAPEQFGIVQTDHRADIFAVGVTMNVLVTGCHPSQSLCRGFLRRIVLKCTRIDPKTRYQTARAVWRSAVPYYALLRTQKAFPLGIRLHTAGLCASAAALCVVCIALVYSLLQPASLPVLSASAADSALSAGWGTSGASAVSAEFSGSDAENSMSRSEDSLSLSAPSSKHSSSETVSDSKNTSGTQISSSGAPSKPSSSASSARPVSSSGASSASSGKPPASSSGASSASSGKPPASSSSAPSSSSGKPSPEEEEIRAAIAEYNAVYSEYQRINALHEESYQRYQALYGYELSQIATRRDLANHDAAVAQNAAAEAQARADAYGAEDPPNLEAQAQAQAEADSYNQLAAQKQAEAEAANAEWAEMYNRPEVQAAYWEFSDYAVQGNALSGQVSAARDRVNYLQKLYGIYLM